VNAGLVVTFVGILVAGLAGILGVWLERDRTAPTRWAYLFTSLIVLATVLKVAHSLYQQSEGAATSEAQARVLERLVAISESGTNPALDQLVGAELAVQTRSNPEVLERLEARVAARGGDPTVVRRKAVAARRAAAGLEPRSRAGKAPPVGAEAARGGKAAKEVLEPAGPADEAVEVPAPVEEGKETKAGKAGKARRSGTSGTDR
jgi:hypothetical protein